MYTLKELSAYTTKQLKVLLEYEGKSIPRKAKKRDLIDLLLQSQFVEKDEVFTMEETPASVRIKRIRASNQEKK